jgi:hypothetical protein
MAAIVIGALPCFAVGMAVPAIVRTYAAELGRDDFMQSFMALWLGSGLLFGFLFAGVGLFTVICGGRAWLSISGKTIFAGSFFGGEVSWESRNCEAVRGVIVEQIDNDTGTIEFLGDGVTDFEVAAGYPLALLAELAGELRGRLKIGSNEHAKELRGGS